MRWFGHSAPFQLGHGLFLETSKILLPWNVPVDVLRPMGPSELASSDRITLSWTDETVFDNLKN